MGRANGTYEKTHLACVVHPIERYSLLASVEAIVEVVLEVRERGDLNAQQQTEHCHRDRARLAAWSVEVL